MLPTVALGVFAVTALGGAFLALRHFTGKSLPMPVALIHGLLGAVGLVLLVASFMNQTLPVQGSVALVLFLVAALGGFFLFFKHVSGKKLPSPVVIIHAVVAVVAFAILALAVL